MNKHELLRRLALATQHAEQARVSVIVKSVEVRTATGKGHDTSRDQALLKILQTREQKHLKEMDWVLDQLDKLDE